MKRIVFLIFLFLLFIIPSKALEVSSDAVILIDEDSNRILYSKKLHELKLIASITKIMTAVITIESNQLDDIVIIDESILEAYGSNIYIEIGEEITLRDLVYGLMLRSGNDASIAIANYLSFSLEHFIKKMNDKAKMIGMKNTIFNNPHGLDEKNENISTVYDMALLTTYANQLEEYKKIVSTKKHIVKTNYKTYVFENKNKLLNLYEYTTGGKTGFTIKAKRTLVSSASKNDMNLIIVTLNDPNDWDTHQKLYNYGFDNYRNYRILNKKNFNIKSNYFKDKLYILNDFIYPLKEIEINDISIMAKLFKNKRYQNNDKIGELEIYFKDDLIYTEDIYIEKKEPSSNGLWQRILSWFNL